MKSRLLMYFTRCFSAEILKTRRTIYLLGVILMPTFLAWMNFFLMLAMSKENEYATENGWIHFAHNDISFWSLLVLPCVIVLVAAFSAHQEHDPKRWRTLMCLALPKPALYLGKLAVVAGLSLLSCLVLWGEVILTGGLLSILRPETGLSLTQLNPFALLLPFVLIFVFALMLLAIHFWFSMRVQNFVLTIGLGFFLSLVGAFMNDAAVWRTVFPWCLPSLVRGAANWQEGVIGLAYSVIGFGVITFLGCRNFVNRDVLA